VHRYLISVERRAPADPQTVFDVLADPAMHPVIDGSGTVRALTHSAPTRLHLGAEFGMDMRLGSRYHVTNRVVEFDAPRRIAWRHFNGHVWRYLLCSVDGGTLVTEQWDATGVWNRAALALLGFPRRNRRGMIATLDRLAVRFEQPTTMTADPAPDLSPSPATPDRDA